ncbi:MAG: hypothetical protein LUQ66_10595 [Methanoregula sp.]|nr:hypothetical protein [Methanoregula sp.]
MDNDNFIEIINTYTEKRPLYEQFTSKMENLIRELLSEEQFNTHSITSRTKSVDSLESKIEKEGKIYKKITDISDLSGVRIICFFSNDVDKVAKIIKKNFKVNEKISIDKRKILEPDRFGYLSLHYIVELPHERVRLTEFKKFKGLMCEVQVRSILQHAWAEIEHDFGYKSKFSIPDEIRRKFSRQAGLLELADEQFIVIKNDIEEYTKKIKEEMLHSFNNIPVNIISIKNYIATSETVKRFDSKIGGIILPSDKESDFENNTPENISVICDFFNIRTIDELDKKLIKNEKNFENFMKTAGYYNEPHVVNYAGHSIWYFGYMLAAQNKKIEEILNYIDAQTIFSGDKDEQMALAKKILNAYSSLK